MLRPDPLGELTAFGGRAFQFLFFLIQTLVASHYLENGAIHKPSPTTVINKSQLYTSDKNDSKEVHVCNTKI